MKTAHIYWPIVESKKGKVYFKLTAYLLVFLITITPFAPVFAKDTTTTTIYPSKFYNSDGTTPTKHIFANDEEIGTVTGTGTEAVPRYIHTDQLTGSNIVTNSSGTIDETIDYLPYGNIRIDSGAYSDQRKYAGSEFDSDTGLNYMNARYYDSNTGRFVSQDPVFLELSDVDQFVRNTGRKLQQFLADPQSLNSYSYARNNPVNKTDPSGKAFGIDDAIAFVLIYLFAPGQLQADPAYESRLYAYTEGYHPQIFFGGDMVSVGGISVPEGNIPIEVEFYRGGNSFDITGRQGADFRVDPKTGYVTRQAGPSVNVDPNNPNVVKYGGPNQITSMPDQLEILQGEDGHGSIVPKQGANLTPQQFQRLLNQVQTKPYGAPQPKSTTIKK